MTNVVQYRYFESSEMNRFDTDHLTRHGRLRQLLTGRDRREPAHDLEQPRSAGVDDTCFTQDVELLRCPFDGLLAARDHGMEEIDAAGAFGRVTLRFLRHLADDGQHRALDGLPHSPVRGVARRAERTRADVRVDLTVRPERVGRAADDLGEDDPGVAARSHQRRTRDLLDEARTALGGRLFELVDDAAGGKREVRTRVAVGNRVDVEVVDPLPAPLEGVERSAGELTDALQLAHAEDLFTSWIRTSTSATVRPVRRSTS